MKIAIYINISCLFTDICLQEVHILATGQVSFIILYLLVYKNVLLVKRFRTISDVSG